MSVIAAALRELIAAGVTGDALVTAVERIEAKFIESIEAETFAAEKARKAAAAERQARYAKRKRQMTSATSDDVRLTEMTSLTSDRHIDKSSSSSESQSKKRKKVSIPENWLPNENGLALARQEGFDEHKIKLEIHRFEDNARQHNRQYVDWQAAWRNWVTSPYQHKGNGHHERKRTLVEIGEKLAADAEAIERAASFGSADDAFGSDQGGDADRQMLSQRRRA